MDVPTLFTRGKRSATMSTAAQAGTQPVEGGTRLLLYTTPIGWQSAWLQSDGTLELLRSTTKFPLEGEGWKYMEAIVKEAVLANAKAIKQAKSISLLLDDASVQITDNKPAALLAASGATARQFGKHWLNVKDVSYGHADLPPVAGGVVKQQKDGIYAFIDAQRVRDYLALLDKDGIKVAEAIPDEYLLVQRAIRSGEPVYGSFHMSGHFSTLLLVNHALGIVQSRRIPVGFLTLVQALAAKMGVPLQDTIQVMAHKNLVANVVPIVPDDLEGAVLKQGQSLHFQALQTPLTRLLDGLKEFLAFFAFQKVAGVPGQLELFGAFDRVVGLKEWLNHHSGMPMGVCRQSMLELFAQMERPIACNLLKGAETSLLTVGRTRFFFTEEHGFVSSQALAAKNAQGSAPSADSQQPLTSAADARKRPGRTSGNRSRSGREVSSGGGGGLSALLNRLSMGVRPNTDAQPQEGTVANERYAGVFALCALAILYWGYSEYEVVAKKYQIQANSYLAASEERDRLMKQIRSQESATRKLGAAVDTTKIFWSEKFLALANNMTKHIWLTDIHLAEDTRSVAGANVKSKTMIVDGRVLPSTDGHIQIISEYIDSLLRDHKWFMSDFREVEFQGAQVEGDADTEGGDPNIHFVLRAFYDKNKRIESKQRGGDGSSPAGLGEMHENIDQHNQQLEDVLSGKKGR